MIPAGTKVFLASHPVDFRKGPDSLLALVRDAGSDPFNGSLYVFRAKRADRIKIAWWDGSGVCLYSAYSDDAGRLFQSEAGQVFRSRAGHGSDLKPDSRCASGSLF